MFDKTTDVPLGSKCRDRLTGFTGIAVGNGEFLHGCARVGLQPEELDDKTGKVQDAEWFDVQRLEILKPLTAFTDDRKRAKSVASTGRRAGPPLMGDPSPR